MGDLAVANFFFLLLHSFPFNFFFFSAFAFVAAISATNLFAVKSITNLCEIESYANFLLQIYVFLANVL